MLRCYHKRMATDPEGERIRNRLRRHLRRAREREAADGTVTVAAVRGMLAAAKTCPCCGKPYTKQGKRKATVHHVIPLARGGAHSLTNLTVLCFSCNTSVGKQGIINGQSPLI